MKILLAGIQCSGKGTQAKLLEERQGIAHLCSGDIMREEYARKSRLGLEAYAYWSAGNYVPDHLVLQMIKRRLHNVHNAALDGFPRTSAQAMALESAGITLDHVIMLELPEHIAIERGLARTYCTNCNAIYGKDVLPESPGFCDKCGSQLIRRVDDTAEKLRKRFRQHNELTPPLLQYYAGKCPVHKIDAKMPVEAVYNEIVRIIHHARF